MAKITILGSCRQDSIFDNFSVTPVRDELTYPHYSSEALQAAKYISGQFFYENIKLDIAFRSFLLNGKIRDSRKLMRDFAQTELFIIEIASRKYYKVGNTFAHHILEDWSFESSKRHTIEIGYETDQIVESNILKMRDIFSPRPMMIVTHFYTKSTGLRFDLVDLIKRIGKKHDIPVFDPVNELGGFDAVDNFTEKETVLSHYSEDGHKVVGEKYIKFIKKNFGIRPRKNFFNEISLIRFKSRMSSKINNLMSRS